MISPRKFRRCDGRRLRLCGESAVSLRCRSLFRLPAPASPGTPFPPDQERPECDEKYPNYYANSGPDYHSQIIRIIAGRSRRGRSWARCRCRSHGVVRGCRGLSHGAAGRSGCTRGNHVESIHRPAKDCKRRSSGDDSRRDSPGPGTSVSLWYLELILPREGLLGSDSRCALRGECSPGEVGDV